MKATERMERFFLDTNVFVYAFLEGESAKAARAVSLIETALATRQGFTCAQVAHEFLHLTMHKFQGKKGKAACLELASSALKPLLIAQDDGAVMDIAIELRDQHRYSFYDCLVVAAAIKAGARVLYTEDLHDGHQIGDLRVVNPFRLKVAEPSDTADTQAPPEKP